MPNENMIQKGESLCFIDNFRDFVLQVLQAPSAITASEAWRPLKAYLGQEHEIVVRVMFGRGRELNLAFRIWRAGDFEDIAADDILIRIAENGPHVCVREGKRPMVIIVSCGGDSKEAIIPSLVRLERPEVVLYSIKDDSAARLDGTLDGVCIPREWEVSRFVPARRSETRDSLHLSGSMPTQAELIDMLAAFRIVFYASGPCLLVTKHALGDVEVLDMFLRPFDHGPGIIKVT